MGTSANINVKVGNKYHSVYVNYDGYPSGVGKMLSENYSSQELAERLVSFGHLNSLDKSCEKPEGHSYETPVKGYSVYYGRDRGEEDVEYEIVDEPVDNEGYCYIWNGTQWLLTGVEYDDDDNMKEFVNTPIPKVLTSLGIETEEVEDQEEHIDTEAEKMLKYFGCDMDQIIAINNEWSVTFNTPDERMTDSYNERIRWMVRHREAPYQGLDEEGIWHHSFFGRTLLEAVLRGEEYLKRGKDWEAERHGDQY